MKSEESSSFSDRMKNGVGLAFAGASKAAGPDLVRGGATMRKLKGLWFLGFGLFLLAVWVYLSWQFYFAMLSWGAKADNPFQIFLLSLEAAAYTLLHPSGVTIWPATMFTLIATGLYRLVRSLLQSHWNDEEEEE